MRDGRVLLPAAQNGSIIAVSYEARERGVTRFFRGREAVAKCPELVLVQVPTSHGKSDMGVYRDFGAKALALIHRTCGEGALTEKARESHTDGGGETAVLLAYVSARNRIIEESDFGETSSNLARLSSILARRARFWRDGGASRLCFG